MGTDRSPGVMAFLGGGSWTSLLEPLRDRLVAAADGRPVVVLPTAAAYEHPERAAAEAAEAVKALGLEAVILPVLRRSDATDADHADAVREAGAVVLVDGSALHLRSVLKDTRVFQAIGDAHRKGAALAAAGAGAGVLCDPMLDPRGGAYTVGLGLLRDMTVFPHFDSAPGHLRERSIDLLPRGVVLAGIDEGTALVRDRAGGWRAEGPGAVTVHRAGDAEPHRFHDAAVDLLPAS
jgi:cyanophycinase